MNNWLDTARDMLAAFRERNSTAAQAQGIANTRRAVAMGAQAMQQAYGAGAGAGANGGYGAQNWAPMTKIAAGPWQQGTTKPARTDADDLRDAVRLARFRAEHASRLASLGAEFAEAVRLLDSRRMEAAMVSWRALYDEATGEQEQRRVEAEKWAAAQQEAMARMQSPIWGTGTATQPAQQGVQWSQQQAATTWNAPGGMAQVPRGTLAQGGALAAVQDGEAMKRYIEQQYRDMLAAGASNNMVQGQGAAPLFDADYLATVMGRQP